MTYIPQAPSAAAAYADKLRAARELLAADKKDRCACASIMIRALHDCGCSTKLIAQAIGMHPTHLNKWPRAAKSDSPPTSTPSSAHLIRMAALLEWVLLNNLRTLLTCEQQLAHRPVGWAAQEAFCAVASTYDTLWRERISSSAEGGGRLAEGLEISQQEWEQARQRVKEAGTKYLAAAAAKPRPQKRRVK